MSHHTLHVATYVTREARGGRRLRPSKHSIGYACRLGWHQSDLVSAANLLPSPAPLTDFFCCTRRLVVHDRHVALVRFCGSGSAILTFWAA
jgi:hypothetical protein